MDAVKSATKVAEKGVNVGVDAADAAADVAGKVNSVADDLSDEAAAVAEDPSTANPPVQTVSSNLLLASLFHCILSKRFSRCRIA